MFVLLSPAKKQTLLNDPSPLPPTAPMFPKQIATLVALLRDKKPEDLAKLMGISAALAELNHGRYQTFDPKRFDASNSQPALLSFDGDVYKHLSAQSLDQKALTFAQDHLLILSGLYGLLRAFDWIQPYRLEMKTPVDLVGYNHLAQMWQKPIATWLNQQPHRPIINLASQEYSQALGQAIEAPIIRIDFKEKRAGTLKTIGILAKRARGAMARYILEHQITTPNAIQAFNTGGYCFAKRLSSDKIWVFVHEQD